jgi:hypothetical protein
MHVHDLPLDRAHDINISHDIKHLSFGEQFPGIVNPLDESKKVFSEGGGVFQYYVKIVRTTYEYLGGQKTVSSNQYARIPFLVTTLSRLIDRRRSSVIAVVLSCVQVRCD